MCQAMCQAGLQHQGAIAGLHHQRVMPQAMCQAMCQARQQEQVIPGLQHQGVIAGLHHQLNLLKRVMLRVMLPLVLPLPSRPTYSLIIPVKRVKLLPVPPWQWAAAFPCRLGIAILLKTASLPLRPLVILQALLPASLKLRSVQTLFFYRRIQKIMFNSWKLVLTSRVTLQ
jgi:hypothetical protein